MSNKVTMGYSFLGNMGAYFADVKNTINGIEISNLSKETYDSAERIRDELLYRFIQPYSKIDPTTREGKRQLAVTIKEDIENLEKHIEAKKVALQMCRKKNVFFDKSYKKQKAE